MSCDFFLFPVISLGRRRKGKRKNRRRRKPRKTTLILLSRTRVKETKWRSVIRRHLLLGPSSRTPVNPRRRHQSLRRRLGRRRRRQIRRRKVQFRRRQMRLRRLRRFQIGGTPCPSFRCENPSRFAEPSVKLSVVHFRRKVTKISSRDRL